MHIKTLSRLTNTIHGTQSETLPKMATEISMSNPDIRVWDKGQLVVIMTRIRFANQNIFVGDKRETLADLKNILLSRTQWTDYIEIACSQLYHYRDSGTAGYVKFQ